MIKAGILVTTFRDEPSTINACLSSCYAQDYGNLIIVCVDGSPDTPVEAKLEFEYAPERLLFARTFYQERAVSREKGIKVLKDNGVDYFLFLDSDMILPGNFISDALEQMQGEEFDGLILKEQAFSRSDNFWTKVKVFERNLYQEGGRIDKTSIEAARMWKMSSFPGFASGLNAFEEIQPTMACLNKGGRIGKHPHLYILHNEKKVTITSLLSKKNYYFRHMGTHESVKWSDMFTRYYFFRRQLYAASNLKKYVQHPFMAAGVMLLYILLTFGALVSFAGTRKGDGSHAF